jgi:hypothetical protein
MTMRRFEVLGWLGPLLAGSVACHHEPPQSPQDVERTALVAQTCPEIALTSEPIKASNARVFVEVVELDDENLPHPLGNWLSEHPVTVRASANTIAFPDVPTSMPWGQCVDAVCAGRQRSLTLTAQVPARGTDPIDLALRIEEAAPGAQPGTAKLLLDTKLRSPSQQPVVLPVSPELSTGSVVVTAYLLRQLDDLHRVLECKAREVDRVKQLQGAQAASAAAASKP